MFTHGQKRLLKLVAQKAGLLGLFNRLEYWKGNPLSARALEFYGAFVKPGQLTFDIGAHMGSKTRLFRRLGARVVAVEPLAACEPVLREAFRDDPQVTVVRAALGPRAGTARFRVCTLSPQLSTVSEEFVERGPYAEHWQHDREEPVPMRTLADLIGEFGRPDYCKIDCEGYDAEVIAGLDQPVPALSFEFHHNDDAGRSRMQAGLQRLEALGYRSFNAISEGRELVFLAEHWVGRENLERLLAERAARGGQFGDVFAVQST